MGRTIACANQKGGVGKTTTVVNLGSYLALAGERVLVVDLDPQGNATSGLGLNRSIIERSIYNAIVDGVPIDELIVAGPHEGLDVVPSAIELAGAEVELAPVEGRERRLKRLLGGVTADVRLHPGRLSAVARTVDRQCADRRRFRAHPVAMRVLRPGRTDPAAGHTRAHSRSPQPRSGDQRRRPDDVRRPNEAVRGRRARRPGGTSVSACTRRSSRGASAWPRHRATVCRSRATPRIRPARSRTRRSPPSCQAREDESQDADLAGARAVS